MPLPFLRSATAAPATGAAPERLPSIRFRLAMLVFACVLPAALVSAYLIYDHYQVERTLLLGEALSTARSMVAVVDRDFDTVTTSLRTLSTSNDIELYDLSEFQAQATNVHAILPITDISLLEPASGRQLMNTVTHAGETAQGDDDPNLVQRVLRGGQPVVSDLYQPASGAAPFVTIGVPVFRHGVIARVLTAGLQPQTLVSILSDQKLPDTWRATIMDSRGTVVARNRDMRTYLGKQAGAGLMQRLKLAQEDHVDTRTLDGIPVVSIYSRSPKSGWTVVLSIPRQSLSAGLLRTLESLILATVVLLTAGLGLAWLVGGRIAASVQALISPATALGTGAPVIIPRLDFKEAEQVAASLQRAALALDQAKQAAASEMAERQSAQAALIAADARKDEFLATLAHELRNPMAPLVNALEILRMGNGVRAPPRQLLEIMERQLRQMVRLIDDLLDVSRITTNKLSIKREPLTLQDVIAYARETVSHFIDKRGHQLLVSLPPEAVRLNGDATRLSQVFANLLNNAAKYTAPGGNIALTAVLRGDRVQVVIADTGIGIPAHILAQVFEIFFQADQSLGRSQAGLGIGLPLARRLVELHGGSLAAGSAGEGQGSTFTVELPLAQAECGAPAAAPALGLGLAPETMLQAHRVLLADDNIDHANTLQTLLDASGQLVHVSYDGLAALLAAESFLPEFAFLDIGMPGLDGYELAQRLRANPLTRHCVLVAVTGWGQEKDQRRAREAGFDFHIVKPVRLAQLQEILAQKNAPR
ncbi:MAG TPA: ATP-binding protein [Janthinobacterium sp.]|nr:ATP-binding protein [Janthinobacterium sp.]